MSDTDNIHELLACFQGAVHGPMRYIFTGRRNRQLCTCETDYGSFGWAKTSGSLTLFNVNSMAVLSDETQIGFVTTA